MWILCLLICFSCDHFDFSRQTASRQYWISSYIVLYGSIIYSQDPSIVRMIFAGHVSNTQIKAM